jgi:hypothetical protein
MVAHITEKRKETQEKKKRAHNNQVSVSESMKHHTQVYECGQTDRLQHGQTDGPQYG